MTPEMTPPSSPLGIDTTQHDDTTLTAAGSTSAPNADANAKTPSSSTDSGDKPANTDASGKSTDASGKTDSTSTGSDKGSAASGSTTSSSTSSTDKDKNQKTLLGSVMSNFLGDNPPSSSTDFNAMKQDEDWTQFNAPVNASKS